MWLSFYCTILLFSVCSLSKFCFNALIDKARLPMLVIFWFKSQTVLSCSLYHMAPIFTQNLDFPSHLVAHFEPIVYCSCIFVWHQISWSILDLCMCAIVSIQQIGDIPSVVEQAQINSILTFGKSCNWNLSYLRMRGIRHVPDVGMSFICASVRCQCTLFNVEMGILTQCGKMFRFASFICEKERSGYSDDGICSKIRIAPSKMNWLVRSNFLQTRKPDATLIVFGYEISWTSKSQLVGRWDANFFPLVWEQTKTKPANTASFSSKWKSNYSPIAKSAPSSGYRA